VTKKLTVIQMLPALESGGVERGTLEMGRYLVDQGHRSIVISAGGRLTDQLAKEGSEHINWQVGKKSLLTLRYVSKVRNLLRTIKPDILHLRSRLPGWVGYLAWKKLPREERPKLVTTVHGPYTVGRYSSRGQRIIAVSNMIRDYIVDNYGFVDPDAISVIYRGVDASQYKFGFTPSKGWTDEWYSQFPQMQGKKLLTMSARLTRWKGQLHFISIIDQLIQSKQQVHGVIVGAAHATKKKYEEELISKIDQLGLNEHISLVGHRTDLKEILAVSAIVFSLSTEPEAFGRTTIEALSLGIPVIGYSHGGVKEQLEMLFPEGAVAVGAEDKVVVKVQQWLKDSPLPSKNTICTLEKMCMQTLGVYNSII